MKIIKQIGQNDEDEYLFMWKINHENILKYYEHFDHEIDALDYTCIITEYCQVCY